jgi:hypothetical protein
MNLTVDQISNAMRTSDVPMKASEIAVKLVEAGVPTNREAVNSALYKGPFERVEGAGAPTWRLRNPAPDPAQYLIIEVPGVGHLYLSRALSDAAIIALITATGKNTLHISPLMKPDDIARLSNLGFAIE